MAAVFTYSSLLYLFQIFSMASPGIKVEVLDFPCIIPLLLQVFPLPHPPEQPTHPVKASVECCKLQVIFCDIIN